MRNAKREMRNGKTVKRIIIALMITMMAGVVNAAKFSDKVGDSIFYKGGKEAHDKEQSVYSLIGGLAGAGLYFYAANKRGEVITDRGDFLAPSLVLTSVLAGAFFKMDDRYDSNEKKASMIVGGIAGVAAGILYAIASSPSEDLAKIVAIPMGLLGASAGAGAGYITAKIFNW